VERVTAGKVYRARPLVAVSRSTAGEVRSRLGHNGPTRVAYNGSPPSTELPRPDPTRRPRRVACVGRLARHKRVADLVQAVPDLPPDVVVDVVGTGDLLGPLRSQVERMRLGDRVVVHGFLPSGAVADVLDRAVLHVQPSAGEGWGLTVLEAAARGVPSVVHPVPGLRESVVDGVTGWHVLPTETLAQALVRALADLEQPGRAEAMAAGCRAYATRFAWEDTVTAFTDLLGSPAPAG
jgi:glycosyltransferase involved in cell wall biosynthesis